MSIFKNLQGRDAKLGFSVQLLSKIFANEDFTKTIAEAEAGEVFDKKILASVKRKANRLYKMSESVKKETEIREFRNKLFASCGLPVKK